MSARRTIPGWTLSETLVMMIVAGIVFVAVMDSVTLFNRFASLKTRQITSNMSLWDGYLHLRDLTAAADSVALDGPVVRLFREHTPTADFAHTDSTLVAHLGPRTDTLMCEVSGLTLAVDTVRVTIRGATTISFRVVPPINKLVEKNLEEREKTYAYE
ncbi:MAG: hypothetical protein LBR57_02125 [Alistipes sp.]|jgi:hypothetical protein|nr:hypothetical protein [Alistipes sp.]